MIITTSTGEEIAIDRPTGREINPDVWSMPEGELRRVERHAIGWRMDVVYYDGSGIRAVGDYRPDFITGSPFPKGWQTCAPEARCDIGSPGHVRAVRYLTTPHCTPHPYCACGLRLMETIGLVSALVGRRGEQFLAEWARPEDQVDTALCISAVVGRGLTCNGESLDPDGTLRTQWLALDDVLLMGAKDGHVAEMFNGTGMDVRVVPDLAALQDA